MALGRLCTPKQWQALPKSSMSDSGYPVYGANGIIGFASQFTHAAPTILVGCRGSIGRIHVTSARAYATSNTMALDNLRTDLVELRFLARFLAWRGFDDVTSGTAQPQLTRQNLLPLEVPLPPLDQQRRIAAILDQSEALRVQRRQALVQLDALARSIFVDMFGDPATNSRGWATKQLSELGAVTTGRTPPTATPGMFGGCVPFVTPGDLESGSPVRRTLTVAGASKSRVVRAGATFVCCIGATIGKVGKASGSSAFNQQINAVEWGVDVNDAYGYTSMRLMRKVVASAGASTTLPLLPKTQFVKLSLPVPPMNLQRDFAARLSSIDASRIQGSLQAKALDGLARSLQSEVFSNSPELSSRVAIGLGERP